VLITRPRLLFATGFSVVSCVAGWLVLDDSSPFRNFFLHHVEIPNLVGRLFLLPYLAIVILRPEPGFNEEALGNSLAFIQWFVFGYFLSLLICRSKSLS
jgi:hypothetical protein